MSVAIRDTVFTIGHSTHPQERFIACCGSMGSQLFATCARRPTALGILNSIARELEEALAPYRNHL